MNSTQRIYAGLKTPNTGQTLHAKRLTRLLNRVQQTASDPDDPVRAQLAKSCADSARSGLTCTVDDTADFAVIQLLQMIWSDSTQPDVAPLFDAYVEAGLIRLNVPIRARQDGNYGDLAGKLPLELAIRRRRLLPAAVRLVQLGADVLDPRFDGDFGAYVATNFGCGDRFAPSVDDRSRAKATLLHAVMCKCLSQSTGSPAMHGVAAAAPARRRPRMATL